MKIKAHRVLAGLAVTLLSASVSAAPPPASSAALPFSERVRLKSEQFSREMAAKKPEVQLLLNKLQLQYVHELDPSKVYSVNRRTGKVSIVSASSLSARQQKDASPNSLIVDGFATLSSVVGATNTEIVGQAGTTVTCPLGSQTADVSGFMASTVSRDPTAGIKDGQITVDNIFTTQAGVNFSLLKISGGARNPLNRTTIQTLHTGNCGDEQRIQSLTGTWPPLRVDMVVDDTSSMSNELDGVKAALASVITGQATSQRGHSYELISFKDAPQMRLPNTDDASAALAAVQALTPAGGGTDCPEDSIGALNLALTSIEADEDSEAHILFVSDASPKNGNIDDTIARAQQAQVRVNVMLSGDCATTAAAANPAAQAAAVSSRAIFGRLARETGGVYFYLPNATTQQYTDALKEIFDSVAEGFTELSSGVTVAGIEGPAGFERIFRIDVPASKSSLRVVSYGGTGNVSLLARRGSVPTSELFDVKSTRPGNSETLQVNNPQAGTWFVKVVGETDFAGVSLLPLVNP